MYTLNALKPITTDLIKKYIEKNEPEAARRKKLERYYRGEHKIKTRAMKDAAKPNNKIVNPYARYITDTMTGYFMGEPVSYTSKEINLLAEIQAIYNYNDEAANNAELAKDASIYGVAYELMYLDYNKDIRFKQLDNVGQCIPIYEDNIEADLLYFIRYYDVEDISNNNSERFVELYTRDEIVKYKSSQIGTLEEIERLQHAFGGVPVNIYKNNAEELGDFELVLSEIDAYDKIESDGVNDMEYFADAYLAITGANAEDEDIASMKEQRVLILPEGSTAQWLIKNINDTYVENLKNRLDKNIHKFSNCPRVTDEEFASNASGVAIKYKLIGLENATAKKERAFKKGLQRRLELICNMLAVMGRAYDYRAINIVFARNIPQNIAEIVDVINKIGNLLSDETKMSMLPMDIDAAAETAKKQQEAEAGYHINYEDVTGNESG